MRYQDSASRSLSFRHAGLGLAALCALPVAARAWQGQPVTPDDRDCGFIVRELIEGRTTALGGVPMFTVTGTPGAIYQIFGGGGFPFQIADTATIVPGVTGAVSAQASAFPASLFVPTTGVFGVIPASGRQDLNLSVPLPIGLAPLSMDLQVFMQQPSGRLDLSDGQMRQIQAVAPPTAIAWANGVVYPTLTTGDWADIEQGDVDGDGDNDTVGAGLTLELWLTTLNPGTLQMQHVQFTGAFPSTSNATSVELADLDNDGFLDVGASFFAGRILRVWMNNGLNAATGVWQGFTELPNSSISILGFGHPADLEVADVDGDGFRDIFLACALNPVIGEQNRLFLNTTPAGLMGFKDVTPTNLPVIRDDSEDCEFVDFDLDGDQDIVIANVDGDLSIFGTGVDYILVNQGGIQGGVMGMFKAPMPNPVPAVNDESLDVVVGDVDADGRPDLYYTNWALSNPSGVFTTTPVRDRLYLNRIVGGTATFVDFSFLLPDAPPGVATYGTDAEIFDVDFDGDLDIVVGLGTLGTAALPFVLPGVPNSSLGIEVLVNPGTLALPFTRTPVASATTFDIRDIEEGDWQEQSTSLVGPWGLYFDKDMGVATTVTVSGPGAGPMLTTLDHP